MKLKRERNFKMQVELWSITVTMNSIVQALT